MLAAFRREVPVRDNGRLRKTSSIQALCRVMMGKAANGDMKAAALMFDVAYRVDAFGEPAGAAANDALPEGDDDAILDAYRKRIIGGGGDA